MDYQDSTEEARWLIRSAGARLARPRASVRPALLAADRARAHQDFVDALFGAHSIDRAMRR